MLSSYSRNTKFGELHLKKYPSNKNRKNIRTEINYGLTVLADFDNMTLQDEEKFYSQMNNPKLTNVTDLDEHCWVVFPNCDDCNSNKKVTFLKKTFRGVYQN